MDFTKENLEKFGFKLHNEENVIINYVKAIGNEKELVFSLSPEQEVFVWVIDEDADDPRMDGTKVILNITDETTFEEIIKCAELISYVEL